MRKTLETLANFIPVIIPVPRQKEKRAFLNRHI